jgi:Tol biopolymer transport system component
MKAIITKIIFLFAILVFVSGNAWSQTPEQLFQKGIMKEEGEGSLKDAIELYKSVADNSSADKILRAKALYQMGSCYEKLGQQEAKKVYEKLVANYTDPQELVANAKRKLNKMEVNKTFSSENTGITMRQITDADENDISFSKDGRFVTYNNWDSINLGVRNLQTGQKIVVTKKGTWEQPMIQYMDASIWSPDSKQIVYGWHKENNTKKEYISELHIVNVDGTNDRLITSGKVYYDPVDWSPDGKHILYLANGESFGIMIYSLTDGTEKQILDLGKRRIWSAHFSSDSKYIVFSAQNDPGFENSDIYSVPVQGGEITELISFKENDEAPWVIPNTNQIVFISSHTGGKDLWSFTLKEGKLSGEPQVIKTGIDENGQITGVLNDGTILYSLQRINPEFYYAKLDFSNNNVELYPLNIKRNPSWKITRTIWSPSLSKAAILLADKFINPYSIRFNIVGYDQKSGKETEMPTQLYTFPWMFWIEPQWTPDEGSVLIKAHQEQYNLPRGIFRIDMKSGQTNEYMTRDRTFSVAQWKNLQFSPDGKTQYFASCDSFLALPMRLISRVVDTGEEKILFQFNEEIEKFFLSPDGKSIAVKYENALQIIPVNNPSETKRIEGLTVNRGKLLGWTNDSKSVLVQKPEGREAWSIWIQPLDGQPAKEGISGDKLKPFFGAGGLMLHYVGDDTFLSMQYGKKIHELWAIENVAQK